MQMNTFWWWWMGWWWWYHDIQDDYDDNRSMLLGLPVFAWAPSKYRKPKQCTLWGKETNETYGNDDNHAVQDDYDDDKWWCWFSLGDHLGLVACYHNSHEPSEYILIEFMNN